MRFSPQLFNYNILSLILSDVIWVILLINETLCWCYDHLRLIFSVSPYASLGFVRIFHPIIWYAMFYKATVAFSLIQRNCFRQLVTRCRRNTVVLNLSAVNNKNCLYFIRWKLHSSSERLCYFFSHQSMFITGRSHLYNSMCLLLLLL